jgi:hypothetical protein
MTPFTYAAGLGYLECAELLHKTGKVNIDHQDNGHNLLFFCLFHLSYIISFLSSFPFFFSFFLCAVLQALAQL